MSTISNQNKKKVTILCIDGGGIRGIIPAKILAHIEQQLQTLSGNPNDTLADYFDLIAGTSTGGILTCYYVHPDRLPADGATNLYANHAKEIFKKTKSLTAFLFTEKYKHNGLEQILQQTFGDATLKDTRTHCVVTAYEMEQRKAIIFTDGDTRLGDIKNYYLRDIARATSAAPTYFEPASILSLKGAPYYLLDGGVYANNPTLCAFVEAHKTVFKTCEYPMADDLLIISIGTGKQIKKYEYKKAKGWGLVNWARPMLDILLSASAEVVHYQMKQLFSLPTCTGIYHRIEPPLFNASSNMDDVSDENIANLKAAGENYVLNELNYLDQIIKEVYQQKHGG